MINSVRAELRRLRRWPTMWILAGVWLVLGVMFGYVFNYLAYRSEDGAAGPVDGGVPAALLAGMMPENVPAVAVQGMPMFGGALVLTLGALAVGSGYGWGTWKTVFTAGPHRVSAIAGTYGALLVVAAGLVALTFTVDMTAALTIATAESQTVTWPSVADLTQGVGAAGLLVVMWMTAGALLGALTRGPALAVGIGLVWTLVVENLLRGVANLLGPVEAVTNVLPGTAAGSLAAALGADTGTPGVVTVLDGDAATALLGAYVVTFVVATGLLMIRRDEV